MTCGIGLFYETLSIEIILWCGFLLLKAFLTFAFVVPAIRNFMPMLQVIIQVCEIVELMLIDYCVRLGVYSLYKLQPRAFSCFAFYSIPKTFKFWKPFFEW